MRVQKVQKIDLQASYPCPACRRQGRLFPIALTEAFGCDRCQQIFVLRSNGRTIEQLSSMYPYKRSWRWTGRHWAIARVRGQDYVRWLPIVMLIMALLLAGLWLILR